ncbi:hypothetical protein TCAL_14438 [Tigriopus californicus]|uniref:Uncharacterized protein n=1 Tax=Tigriopus californicus TaxID=6832 RepID=A0A553PLR7_TIGCA|nr:hypothetical protein TCAL_14438 [Tigriopus californicus]
MQRYLQTQLCLIHDQIQTTDHKLHDLISLMEISGQPQPPQFRGRRSALLMAGLVAIGSTLSNLVYSCYLSTPIDGIQQQEDYLTHGLDILTRKTADNTRQLEILDKAVDILLKQHLGVRQQLDEEIHMHQVMMHVDATYRSLATYTQTLAEILTTITAALQGKVDTYLISPAQVRQELQQIKQRIPDNMKIAIEANHITDFYALPCHAKITSTTFHVAVPIPIFNVKETLDLYKHIPTPLVVDQGLEIFLSSHTRMLATNTENTLYLNLDASNIQACLNVGTLYLCPALQVQLKDNQPSCLHLLFRGLTEQAMHHCQHRVRLTRSLELTLTESHSVLVTASEPRQIQQECQNHSLSKILTVKPGQASINIPDGCSLASQEFNISPTRISTVHPLRTLVQVPHEPEVTLEHIIQSRQEQANRPAIPIEAIRKQLQSSRSRNLVDLDVVIPNEPPSAMGWWITIAVTSISSALVISIILWHYRRLKHQERSGRAFPKRGLCSGIDDVQDNLSRLMVAMSSEKDILERLKASRRAFKAHVTRSKKRTVRTFEAHLTGDDPTLLENNLEEWKVALNKTMRTPGTAIQRSHKSGQGGAEQKPDQDGGEQPPPEEHGHIPDPVSIPDEGIAKDVAEPYKPESQDNETPSRTGDEDMPDSPNLNRGTKRLRHVSTPRSTGFRQRTSSGKRGRMESELYITPLFSQLQNILNIDGYLQAIWKSISLKSRQMNGRYLAFQIWLVREQVTTAKASIEDITAVSGNRRLTKANDSQPEPRSALLVAALTSIGAGLSNLFYSQLLALSIDQLREDNDHLVHGVQILTRLTQENSRKILFLEKAVHPLAN